MTLKANFPPTTKKELRAVLNISRDTLRRYLNEKYFDELVPLGYQKHCNYLPGKVVEYLAEKLCFSFE